MDAHSHPDRDRRTDVLIQDHVLYAMTAAAIPVPVVDIGAVTAVQLDLVRKLAGAHRVEVEGDLFKATVTSLLGASLARVGASAFKVVPGIGSLAGGAAQVLLSGASTYAVGQTFGAIFAARRTVRDMAPEEVQQLYRHYFGRGRRIVRDLWQRAEEQAAPPHRIARTLERLARLRDEGVLSDEEFEQLKQTALGRDSATPPPEVR